jgi:hypothetical protein
MEDKTPVSVKLRISSTSPPDNGCLGCDSVPGELPASPDSAVRGGVVLQEKTTHTDNNKENMRYRALNITFNNPQYIFLSPYTK